MAGRSSAISPTFRSYLANTAAVAACLPTTIGLGTMLRPQLGLEVFGFPTPTASQDVKLVHGLFQLFGARDVALGLITLAIWYHGCRNGRTSGYTTLGATMLAGSIVPIADGFVSRQVISSGEWMHWVFVPINLAIGVVLSGLM